MKKLFYGNLFGGDNRHCRTGKQLRHSIAVAVTALLVPLLYSCCPQPGCSQRDAQKAPDAVHTDASPTTAVKGTCSTTPTHPEADKPLPPSSAGLPVLTALKGTGELVPTKDDHFLFAAFGDSQGGGTSTAIASKIFRKLRENGKIAFGLCLGDIVKGKDPQDPAKYITQKFEEYLALAKTAQIPFFNAPGNHEMDDANDIPSKKMHNIYQAYVAPSYGAFNYGNARFIALNTENVPPEGTSPPPPGMEFSFMNDTQLNDLDADLEANRDKTHVFIAMHYPMKPQRASDALAPESLSKLSNILAKYKNISYVLASHEHLYYNPQDPGNTTSISAFKAGEPTRYLVSGGAGAEIYVDESSGGFHHYLVFEVNGDTVNVTINRVGN